MKTYRIDFNQVVVQREYDRAYVEAESKEEAIKKLKLYNCVEFHTMYTEVIDADEFEDIEIKEILINEIPS